MRLVEGLGRQIVLSMVAATLSGVAVTIFGIYMFYGALIWFAPHLLPDSESWLPVGIEWLAVAALAAVSTVLAFLTALRLTRRIVAPLTSVAVSARKIAHGDLTARAAVDDRSLGEAAMLVDDFNHMAAHLEISSDGVARWNALIAHELRTPITILTGRLQGLSDGVFRPDPALFRSLLTQAQGLARLVKDLRTVSLSDAGYLDLVCHEVELADELDAVIHLMKPALAEAGFSLSVELMPGRCAVDPTRIRQALVALLTNARLHARPGELRVMLSILDQQVEIMVADQGPGLPASFAENAFEPFRRHVAEGEVVPGSGLGLAVVRAVAQAHGGDAIYEARNGGACFRIRFNRYAIFQSAEQTGLSSGIRRTS